MGTRTRATAPTRRWRVRDHAAGAALGIGAALVIAYFLLPSPDIQDFAYQVPGMLAVVTVLAGVRIQCPSRVAATRITVARRHIPWQNGDRAARRERELRACALPTAMYGPAGRQ